MIQGVGVGLRSKHFATFIEHQPNVPWLEVLADNYLHSQGILLEKLQTISKHYPTVIHGVSLSIAGTDPLDRDYLTQLTHLQQATNAVWISDHLCWCYHQGHYSHDLLPFPFTHKNLQHVVARIKKVQDILQQQILIENISSYLECKTNQLFEAEFLAQVAELADCAILLDVNNVYVNSQNHGFNASDYFEYLDVTRIKQIHLGGYTQQDSTLIDTHGEAIHDPVWLLYELALKKFGAVATAIEWDNHVPDWPTLFQQTQHADTIWQQYCKTTQCN